MIKLGALAREPYWLDTGIPGLRLKMRPITPVMMIVAQKEAARLFAEDGADDDPTIKARVGIALVRALAHSGIAEWEGVAGENDEPAPVTPDNIDRLLSLWRIHDAIDRLYVEPVFTLVPEGNGSAVSPNGTSGTAAPNTARPAA